MATTYIKLVDFVQTKQIETTFIHTLADNGLLTLTIIEEQEYLDEVQLSDLEKFAIWYYDLQVNHAGIEVAHNLLQKIEQLQQEVAQLQLKTKYLDEL